MTENNIIHGECIAKMNLMRSGSYDCILTDPPYLYLKGQKLEREFDEQMFFTQCRRVLKKDGFIVIFGRGKSFYRWCTMLSEMGFNFKEEIVWDKGHCTSPLLALNRVHETIAIFSKGRGIIQKAKIPYLEMKQHDLPSIIQDVKRLKAILNNTSSLDATLSFLKNNVIPINADKVIKHAVATKDYNVKSQDRSASVLCQISGGLTEKSIIRGDLTTYNESGKNLRGNCNTGDRACNVMQSVQCGMTEKSIIKQVRDHYTSIHSTQKPVPLLERLLALTTKPGDCVLDPFSGSGSTTVACINKGLNSTAIEIDQEYYDGSMKRVQPIIDKRKMQLF